MRIGPAMTNLRRAMTVLGLHAAAVGMLGSALLGAAAEPALPPAAPPKPEPAKVNLEDLPEIVFYVAKGDANACGHGCDRWIAADGKIDAGAPQRFRRLLAKSGNGRLPIFFHSPGGAVGGALELGRVMRQQKLTAGVARTIPHGCDRDNFRDKSCEALKRSGTDLEAEFDTDVTQCNSSCVYALIGGTARLVPPWAKLGIHDVGPNPKKPAPRGTSLGEVQRAAHVQILAYVREMGLEKALPQAAAAVPHESVRFLERYEIAEFGIDRREFGEAQWRFVEKPTAALIKKFFVRSDDGDPARYRNGYVRLDCGAGRQISLAFAQDRESSEKPTDPHLDVNGQQIALRPRAPWRQFDVHGTWLSADMFDLVRQSAKIKVSGLDRGQDGSQRAVTLSMDGFSDASAKLRRSCDGAVRPAIASAPQSQPVASASVPRPQPSTLQNNPSTQEQAIADYTERIRLDPKHAESFNRRGVAYDRKGEYDRAIADYTEAIRLDPNYAAAYNNRGNIYRRRGDQDQAIADYTEAIRINPNYAVAYTNRGVSHRILNDYDRAVADHSEAIRLNPKYPAAYNNRGSAYNYRGDYDLAIVDLNEAIRLNPNYAVAYNNRGLAYSHKGEFDRAVADLNEAIRLNPNYAAAYRNRGLAYSNIGNIDHAIADLNEAIRLDPKSARSYAVRADVYSRSGEHDRGIADCIEAIRLDPKSDSTYTSGSVCSQQ
jgi:tetratricopeptide (TPR) repeat protein